MSKIIKTNLVFDGEYLKEHSIDINILAPSLLGLANLIQNANKLINKDRANVIVKVNAGVKQNCFELSLHFDWSIIEHIKDLLNAPEIKDLKNILEWIGLIGLGSSLVSAPLFYLIKKYKGEKIKEEDIIKSDKENTTIKGNIIVNNNVITFYNNIDIQKNSQQFMKILENEGIDEIKFVNDGETSNVLHKKDYREYINTNLNNYEVGRKTENKNITIRNLVVFKPVLSDQATYWTFMLDNKAINVNISLTDIAKNAIKRGAITLNDTYKVELEEEEYRTATGQYRTTYKILKVLEFKQGDIN